MSYFTPKFGYLAHVGFGSDTYLRTEVAQVGDNGSWVLVFKGEPAQQRAIQADDGTWFLEETGQSITFTPNVYLRPDEMLLKFFPNDHERHCAWGKHTGTPCGKPVVQIQWQWEKDFARRNNAPGVTNSWRHEDGTPLHKIDGMTIWHSPSCEPIPRCDGCGVEFLNTHCRKCHGDNTLITKQLAYGDDTRCTTEGCDYHKWYSIGD